MKGHFENLPCDVVGSCEPDVNNFGCYRCMWAQLAESIEGFKSCAQDFVEAHAFLEAYSEHLKDDMEDL